MENNKDLKTTVDEFLTEENELKVEKSTEKESEEECNTPECKMKNGKGLIERVNKIYVDENGKQLLMD